MTDEELRALVASLATGHAKTDAQLAETDAQLAKTDAQLAKTDAQLARTDAKLSRLAELYGGAANNQGQVAEDFFFNSLKHRPELAGLRFDFIDKNVTRSRDGLEDEYDLLLVASADVCLIEVKYRLHANDLDDLLNRKVGNFRKLFPEYGDHRLHLALATFAADGEVKRLATAQGVAVLQRRGRVIETLAA